MLCNALLSGFHDRLTLNVERKCELAERLDLVHQPLLVWRLPSLWFIVS